MALLDHLAGPRWIIAKSKWKTKFIGRSGITFVKIYNESPYQWFICQSEASHKTIRIYRPLITQYVVISDKMNHD